MVNPANGQKLSYGEIAAFAKVPSPLPAVDPKELKARKDWRLIGKGVARRDTPSKANGTAIYGIDVKLPGMVYATSMHAPVHTGTLESFNEADIKKMPGVIATVRLPNGVAVVAQHFEQAKAARDAIKAVWKDGAAAGFDSAQGARRLRQAAPRPEGADHQPVQEGRRRRGLLGCGEEVQRRVPQRLRLSRADGAAERGGARGGRRPVGRGLGGHAGRRRHPRRGGEGARHRARQGEGDPVLHGRRLRPALARRLRRRMRAHRQAGRPPGEAGLDPRGGHRPRHVPPAVVPVHRGGAGRDRQGDRLAALRGRRRRRAAAHRHPDPVLRGAEPEHRAARRLARHPAQALARGRPCVQRHGDREHGRRDGDRRQDGPDRLPLCSGWR